MNRPGRYLWLRIGLVCIAYLFALALVFPRPVSQPFAFMILILPLAITGFAFGPLVGVGFGVMTGVLATTLMLLTEWQSIADPVLPVLSVALYLAIGAGFGLLHPRNPQACEEDTHPDAWEHALDIQLRLDARGTVLDTNLRARNVLGNPSHFMDFVHPEEKDAAKEQLEYAYSRAETRWTLRVIDSNQRVMPVEAQLVRDRDDLVLELHDLTELYSFERRLSETEARYRVLIEDAIAALDTGILVLDRNREVIWANEALARVMGVDQEWLVGRNLDRVLEQASSRFLSPDVTKQIAETASATHLTIAIQNGKGPRIFDFNSVPISTKRYQGGRIDYYHDITHNKTMEEELRQKTERLTAINERLEAFTHVVSHDLKEPLRTLEMFSAYVIEDYESKLDEEGKEYLRSIGRAAKRMKGLIEDLLDLASIGRRNEPKQLLNLDQAIKDVLLDLEASLEGVEVVLPKAPFPEVLVNPTRIEQLFSNLISNAVKYNDKEQKQVTLDWHTRGKDYVFQVSDNGIGIEEDYLGSRIFELFERLNPHQDNFEGTGAGLAICKRIVEEYGGKIWAESKFGEGSSFYFTLPKPNTEVVNDHETVKDLVG